MNLPSPFEIGDGAIDLTVGWDQLDQALADATPPAATDDQFAELLAELRVEGLAPFDATEESVDDAAWEPLFTADQEPPDREPLDQEVDWSALIPAPAATGRRRWSPPRSIWVDLADFNRFRLKNLKRRLTLAWTPDLILAISMPWRWLQRGRRGPRHRVRTGAGSLRENRGDPSCSFR